MSLYRDRRSPFWRFDFQYRGHRFYGRAKTHGSARGGGDRAPPSAGGSGISDPPHNALVLCLIDSWSMRLRRAGARGPWARLGGADPRIRNTRSPEDSHLLERVDWCASNNDKSIYSVQRTVWKHVRLHRLIFRRAGRRYRSQGTQRAQQPKTHQCSPVR